MALIYKSVICYNLDGDIIKYYNYIKEAADDLNLNASNIVGVCKGKHKRIGKYKFKYNE